MGGNNFAKLHALMDICPLLSLVSIHLKLAKNVQKFEKTL